MGRPPAHEPDVYVYVPKVHVGELNIDVERLEAHLALRAEVANLVNLVAGVHVGIDKVKIDLKDVDAECELKVRLENTYNILDPLDNARREPRAGQGAARYRGHGGGVDRRDRQGGDGTGGALSELTSGVGDTLAIWAARSEAASRPSPVRRAPKQLTSGSSSGTKKAGGRSNGSTAAKTVAAAGATGILGGALIGLTQRNGGLLRSNGAHAFANGYRRRASASRAEQRRDWTERDRRHNVPVQTWK